MASPSISPQEDFSWLEGPKLLPAGFFKAVLEAVRLGSDLPQISHLLQFFSQHPIDEKHHALCVEVLTAFLRPFDEKLASTILEPQNLAFLNRLVSYAGSVPVSFDYHEEDEDYELFVGSCNGDVDRACKQKEDQLRKKFGDSHLQVASMAPPALVIHVCASSINIVGQTLFSKEVGPCKNFGFDFGLPFRRAVIKHGSPERKIRMIGKILPPLPPSEECPSPPSSGSQGSSSPESAESAKMKELLQKKLEETYQASSTVSRVEEPKTKSRQKHSTSPQPSLPLESPQKIPLEHSIPVPKISLEVEESTKSTRSKTSEEDSSKSWEERILEVEEKFANRFGSLEKQIGSLQTQNGSLQTQIGSLQLQGGSLQTQIGSLHTHGGSLETQLGSLQNQGGSFQTQIGSLQLQNGSLETQIGALQMQNGTLESHIASLGVQIGSLETQIESHQKEIDTLRSQNGALAVEIGLLRKQNLPLVTQIEEQTQKIDSLQTRNGSLEEQMKEIRSEMEARESRIELFQSQYVSLETQIGSLQTQNGSLETQIGALQTQIGSLQSQNGSLETQIGSLQTQNGSLLTQISAFHAKTVSRQKMEGKVESTN